MRALWDMMSDARREKANRNFVLPCKKMSSILLPTFHWRLLVCPRYHGNRRIG